MTQEEAMKEADRLAKYIVNELRGKFTSHGYDVYGNDVLDVDYNRVVVSAAITAAEARGRRIGLEEAAKFVENKYVPYGPYKPVSDRTRKRIPETAQLIANAIRALIQKG